MQPKKLVFLLFVIVLFIGVIVITVPLISQSNEGARAINLITDTQRETNGR